MPLDAATTAFLAEMTASGAKPIHESTPEEVRALGGMLADLYGPGPEVAHIADHTVNTPTGDFTVRVMTPENPRGILIYYHGGGWVIGALDEYNTLGRKLATQTGCTVVLPEYRLAPEHRYPTAADDAYAALEWVAAHAVQLGGSDLPIIVSGDSAGGNLATVTALRARDRHGPQIAMQVLIYPVTDADFDRPAYHRPENQLLLSRDGMIWFWDHYLPDAARRTEPDAAPLRAENLAGLPPTFMLLAEYDVLRDEGEAYAARLQAAGVPIETKVYEGQMHAFFTLVHFPASAQAISDMAAAIDTHVFASTA